MRILVVAHGFPPFAQGGSEIYAHDHARALAEVCGDDILVLTRENDEHLPELHVRSEQRGAISIVWINNTFAAARTFADTYRNDRIGKLAADVIDQFEPDVAHIHHLTCLSTTIVEELAARRIPTFFTLHDYWLMCHRGQRLDRDYRVCEGPPDCKRCIGASDGTSTMASAGVPLARRIARTMPPALATRFRRSAARAAARFLCEDENRDHADKRLSHMKDLCGKVTMFFAPSQHMRQRFLDFGIPANRILFSPYGFDAARFAQAGRQEHQRLRLGFMGTLMVSKAPHLLLEAFGGLPANAASVDLVGKYSAYHGDDTYRDQLAPLLKQENVSLHEPVAHDRVGEFLKGIDVLVVPSVWEENSPLVIGEAFLAGVPVVASNIGGIPEVVLNEQNGLLFEPGNVSDLRRALTRFVDEPGLLQKLRRGIGQVRTIEDDVVQTRKEYERAGRPPAPKLAAIVLNYRTAAETYLAVKSLSASRRAIDDIIVVDNEATDECREMLSGLARPVTYLPIGQNLGFSGGVNHGIRYALEHGATRVLLVNSDIVVPPDCVERLENGLERARGAGIAGPVVLSRCDPDRVASLGMRYVPSTGRMRHLGANLDTGSVDRTRNVRVDGVSGCMMLVESAVFEAAGLFDEDYFFSFEDLDFCLKAQRRGFSTVLVTTASVYHEGSQSIGSESADRLYFASRNHLLLARRVESGGRSVRSAFRTSAIVALNVAHAVRANGSTAPRRLAAVAKGTRDYFTGRLGAGSADL